MLLFFYVAKAYKIVYTESTDTNIIMRYIIGIMCKRRNVNAMGKGGLL